MRQPRFSRLPFSYVLASLLLLALTLWLVLGDFNAFRSEAPADAASEPAPTRVETRQIKRMEYTPVQVVQGELEAVRDVALRASVEGFVQDKPVKQGERVSQGETLLVLDNDALPERLKEARDNVELARSELAGAEKLRRRELIAKTELLRRRAALSQGIAEVARLEKQQADTRPKAPFAGRLDRVSVDLGELVQPGEEWGRLIADDTLKGIGWVSQQDVGPLEEGQRVTARLLSGHALEGTLTHVASRAEDDTRSFYMEATLANPERQRLAGASAELSVELPPRRVHALSPALLRLNDSGELSVRHLGDDGRVRQTAVELVSADTDRAYVAGLPESTRLITLGAGLVAPGDPVKAVPAGDAAGSDR
ncbi:efflux RND transporter periplasmic adaptor subunit [Halomonas piscis]|uniref:efflux RND transporter periplasmic adaptor subunit n=1 Tax=Halomonas piscis TaxID=3031727 RepID=UPI00289BBBF2|nr:efflux RND transporter periplasmic adaptor subunit [Halomonas piscis]